MLVLSSGKRPGCKDRCNNFYLNWHEELILYGYLPAVTKCAEFSVQRAACPHRHFYLTDFCLAGAAACGRATRFYQPGRSIMTSKSRIVLATLVGATLGASAIHGLHAQTKPKAYTVTELETLDAKGAADVAARVQKMQEGAGGRNFRTGGGKVTGMEGSPPPQRVAITEWDNVDKAQAFFKSKEWADLGPERDKALKTIRRYVVEVRD
jgi:uncharacterized protein (DUF1330 family)